MRCGASAMDIKAALSWAFLDELPKREVRSVRAPADRRPQALTRSSVQANTLFQAMMEMPVNRFGVVRDLGSFGAPHPDAVAIEFPPDWRPLPELHGLHPEVTRLIDDATAGARARVGRGGTFLGTSVPALVRRHALARTAPDWRFPLPELRYRTHSNGQPQWFVRRVCWKKSVDGRDVQVEVEEDGMNPRGKRPYGDAYRKPYPEPPKSACIGCPFHPDAAWRRIRDHDPEAWADAVDVDRRIRTGVRRLRGEVFLHRSAVPLGEADLSTAADRGQLDLWPNKCEGLCGV